MYVVVSSIAIVIFFITYIYIYNEYNEYINICVYMFIYLY